MSYLFWITVQAWNICIRENRPDWMRQKKEQAEVLLGRYEDNDSITLISCGSEPEVMYQGTDKATVKRRIRDITVTNEAGTLSNSTDYINSLVADMENVEIVCYTDTEFDSTLLTKKQCRCWRFGI